MFQGIRKLSLVIMSISIFLLAFFAILGVWEVVRNDVLYKSLSSMGLLTVASLLVLIVSLERDKKWIFSPKNKGKSSFGGSILKGIIFIFFVLIIGGWFIRWIF